jgi:arylformamidase
LTWIDISILLRPGTPEWPGDTPFDCRWAWSMAAGASVNVSCVTGSPHNGTHADAPLHVRPGAEGSHLLPVDAFVGPAWVSDVHGRAGALEVEDLALPDEPVSRLLLRTGSSIATGAFPEAWPALSPGAARALTARGVRLVGVDCPSVDDRHSTDLAVHHALFGGGAQVLENLDLSAVAAGPWELVALPLRLFGLDAAPVRALLRPRR